MRQILDSYNIIIQLDDEPSDLAIIKKELSKIRGQLTVLKNKLKSKEYQSDDLVTLYKVSLYYTETYDFSREINLLSQIYYNDPLRLKNLRYFLSLSARNCSTVMVFNASEKNKLNVQKVDSFGRHFRGKILLWRVEQMC